MVLIQEMAIETFVLRFRLEKYLVTGIENRNAPSNSISTHSDACMPHALWYFVRNDDEKEKKIRNATAWTVEICSEPDSER